MSALLKADIGVGRRQVRYGPRADLRSPVAITIRTVKTGWDSGGIRLRLLPAKAVCGSLHALGLGQYDRLHALLQINRQSRGIEGCATPGRGLVRLA